MSPDVVVVLSRPETPDNIGSVARCMLAFGVDELRLVGIHPINESSRAYASARTGEVILRNARYFDTISEAVADCQQAFGFTRRTRDKSQEIRDLPDVETDFENVKTALVFGCESRGLSQEETLEVTHLVRIPSAESELSLNLSHAVAIALYALVKPVRFEDENSVERPTLAESQQVMDQVLEVLDRNGFLAKGNKEAARREKVEMLWQRFHPTKGELEFLSGALRAFVEKVKV